MKNSKLRRALLLFACAVLLVCLSVGATLAYLTSTTQVVENTFTVGKVRIGLDEAKVNQFGEWIQTLASGDDSIPDFVNIVDNIADADRVLENEYKLYPGKQYPKDPTIHVFGGSESCYVFIRINKTGLTYTDEDGNTVDIEAANGDGYTRIKDQIAANGWLPFDEANGIYVYKNIVNTLLTGGDKDIQVFTEFKIDGYATVPNSLYQNPYNAQMAELKLNVIGFAIQAEGFTTHDLANDASDNNLETDMTGAQKAWDAAQFNTSFDQ